MSGDVSTPGLLYWGPAPKPLPASSPFQLCEQSHGPAGAPDGALALAQWEGPEWSEAERSSLDTTHLLPDKSRA